MKVLIIQPPKYFWPYISSDDNFLVPQALPCLASVLQQHGHLVRLIDCSPMRIGWQTLKQVIIDEAPDIVAVGENHALYAHESLKVMQLAKSFSPEIITIAGGAHFTNLIAGTLDTGYVDYIVLREGEETFAELVDCLAAGKTDLSHVKGIAFLSGTSPVTTPPRPLIADLDSLPMPAYELLPMNLYGRSKFLFSPGGTTIHHSRGCVSNCRFCAWWRQMAEPDTQNPTTLKPVWRTKSVEYTIDEIKILAERFNKRCLVFVDEFWNKDPEWNGRFADALTPLGLGVEWFAFMRADAIIRDENLGIMEKLVKSGLVHVSVGVERIESEELKKFGKGFYGANESAECFRILREKYPTVFRQGTFIVGVKTETKASMLAQVRFARELQLDYPGFHPVTPIPGTEFWKEADQKGWIEVTDYQEYDWMTPIISSETMTRREIEEMLIVMNKKFVSLGWFLKGILSVSRYKRSMYIWSFIVTLRVVFDSIKRLAWPVKTETYSGLVKPEWYDK